MLIVWHRGPQWEDQGRIRQEQAAPSGAPPVTHTGQWMLIQAGTPRWVWQSAPSGVVSTELRAWRNAFNRWHRSSS